MSWRNAACPARVSKRSPSARPWPHQRRDIAREHRELRMSNGPVLGETAARPPGTLENRSGQPIGGRPAGDGGREIPRPCRQIAPQHARRDQTAIEQPAQTASAAAARPAARTPAPHRRRLSRGRGRFCSERSSASSTRRGTSVSSASANPGSTSASSGNSRSSPRQNASIVEMAMSPRRPRRSRQRAASSARRPARFLQPLDDPLPHLGGGLAREGDRQNVLGLDAGSQQVDVALHEHARLAGAGGGFEHDVLGPDRPRYAGTARRQSQSSVVSPTDRHCRSAVDAPDCRPSAATRLCDRRLSTTSSSNGSRGLRRHRRSPCGRRR